MKLDFDGDIDTSGEIELLEFIHGAGRWVHDVQDAFVGAEFELIDTLLINVRGAVNAELLDASRKWDRACNFGPVRLAVSTISLTDLSKAR